jgi:hypothetical protein
MSQHNHAYSRDRASDQYVRALDTGDLDVVLAVLQMAEVDEELDRMIGVINQAYAEEIGLSPVDADAEQVRQLMRKHLTSAFAVPEAPPDEPLTVGEVAARLASEGGLPEADQEITRQLLNIQDVLPEWLGFSEILKLGEKLRIRASERFWDTFRDIAIQMAMGRGQAQMAAARSKRRHLTPQANTETDKPNEPD